MSLQQTIGKLGFLTDQKGIQHRYVREKFNWQEHIDKTKQFIQSRVKMYKPSSIAILGSGWLLDVPADWLVQYCKMVYLVDVFHPYPAKQLQKQYGNVILLQNDLSGCAEQTLQVGKRLTGRKKAFEKIMPNIQLNLKADYWISVNLLDQLDTLLLDYIRKKITITDLKAMQFSHKVQEAHIQFLRKNNSSVICSIKEKLLSMQDELKAENKLLHAELPENNTQQWTWVFDTNGSYYPKCKTIFEVMATDL